MLEKLTPGTELDGFVIGERIHSGAQGVIFRVTSPAEDIPLIMKVPRVGRGETSESLLNFETEAMILPALSGPHVPHFIAAGDLLNWVLARRSENRGVNFIDAHRMVALFFGAMGINEHAKVKVRNV